MHLNQSHARVDRKPLSIRGQNGIRISDDAHADHQSIGQPQATMAGAKGSGGARYGPVDVSDNVDGAVDPIFGRRHHGSTEPAGANQDLGERCRRQNDLDRRRARLLKRDNRRLMVSITIIEKGNQDAGVNDYRSHSFRSASRSVAALNPGMLPARSSNGSWSRVSVI